MSWTGLDRVRLGWIGLSWIGLGVVALGSAGLDWAELERIRQCIAD